MKADQYAPAAISDSTSLQRFIWWLATAEPTLVSRSVVDRNRFQIIGLTVLCTWLYATIAWTLLFISFGVPVLASILPGLLMGFIILCIDRALIRGISRSAKRKLVALFMRGMLALLIGTFMAQPVVLYMFNKEILLQKSLDDEERRKIHKSKIDQLYSAELNLLSKRKTDILNGISIGKAEVSKARENYLSETDGSGGSGKLGIKDIAIAKRDEYLKLQEGQKLLEGNSKPELIRIDSALNALKQETQRSENSFRAMLNDGFLTRIEALSNLLDKNAALQFRYYLIILILMLIELMPVIAKAILPGKVYEHQLQLQEEMEMREAGERILQEEGLDASYREGAASYNRLIIAKVFKAMTTHAETRIEVNQKEFSETGDPGWESLREKLTTNSER